MKTDKEFLKGVYEKVDMLERESIENKPGFGIFLKYSSVAAIFILIPLLYMMTQGNPATPQDIPLEVAGPRVRSSENTNWILEYADTIVTGVVEKRVSENGNQILIRVASVVRGQVSEDSILVSDNLEYKGEFAGREAMFLLENTHDGYSLINGMEGVLYKDAPGLYVDVFGQRHSEEKLRD
ncbi:MAG: hypothetical protein NUK57_05880 [Gudongella sp.]|nr:hypothetical protein [Gudongella sp.]